jgi:hypothetical protein
MYDDVLCNSDLFGKHRGEKHQTKSLNPSVPGDTYEITSSGRLELLECTFVDRSDPNAQGWERLFGFMTPVPTGNRRDLNYHGWLELTSFGRARFTDGTMVEFNLDLESKAHSMKSGTI